MFCSCCLLDFGMFLFVGWLISVVCFVLCVCFLSVTLDVEL